MAVASWITTTVPLFCRLQQFPQVVSTPVPHLSFHIMEKSEVMRCSRHRNFARVGLVDSGQGSSSLDSHEGEWEDPDDGSGSEYNEEDEEVEGNESDFDGDDVAAVNKSAGGQYEEDLAREVEQLLGPDERAILQQNTAPNLAKISTAKWRPLQTLGLSVQIPFMDKLLENGVDIDEVDKDGLTALHKAIIGKKEAVISHLLRKGASPHIKDRDGATPLHYAVQVGAMQTVKLLIKHNVDVNVADIDGWTPLHIAVQSRNRNIVKVLLIHGADKTIRNKDGKTALDLSLCYGRDFKSYDLAKLLKIIPADRDP
ncbi:hypothetical protein SLE2022_192980 [Rubroshorea leprosula]